MLNFLLCDAGESYALSFVFPLLDQKKIDYSVWAMGFAATYFQDKAFDLTQKWEAFENPSRRLPVSSSLIEEVVSYIGQGVVISGMARFVQRQLLEAMQKKGCYTVGYFDSFMYMHKEHISYEFLPFLDELIVPIQEIKERLDKKPTHVLGNPTLEAWGKGVEEGGKLRHQLGIEATDRVVVYIGGYDPFYCEAMKRFLSVTFAVDHILIALHPSSDGAFERQLLKDSPHKNISFVPRGISTQEAVALADQVICTRSTVGVQALCMGKKVFYFDSPQNSYTNIAIDKGWVEVVHDEQVLKQKIEALDPDPSFQWTPTPKDSKNLLAQHFEGLARHLHEG